VPPLPLPRSFNEPHFRNYIACDMGALFKSAGFECQGKWMASATKTLSFTKPAAGSAQAGAGTQAAAAGVQAGPAADEAAEADKIANAMNN
jgi:hypothetical protein